MGSEFWIMMATWVGVVIIAFGVPFTWAVRDRRKRRAVVHRRGFWQSGIDGTYWRSCPLIMLERVKATSRGEYLYERKLAAEWRAVFAAGSTQVKELPPDGYVVAVIPDL